MPRLALAELCAGYGGLHLGTRLAGWPTDLTWYAETDPEACAVLRAHHPGIANVGDVSLVDWRRVEPVDILAAGWPCQPYSRAGKQLGDNDDRAVWPHILDAVRVVRPSLVFGENVPGILGRGQLGAVLQGLAAIGYVGSWLCLRASDLGAPHRRERTFILAVATGVALRAPRKGPVMTRATDRPLFPTPSFRDGRRGLSSVEWSSNRLATRRQGLAMDAALALMPARGWGRYASTVDLWSRVVGRAAPAALVDGAIGRGRQISHWFIEWMMGLPAGYVTDHLDRRPALRVLGNGVVPIQAATALRALQAQLAKHPQRT